MTGLRTNGVPTPWSWGSSVKSRLLLGMGAAVLLALLILQPLFCIPLALAVLALVAMAWPGALLGISFTGFFLYLGVLRIAGLEPRTAITFGYYFVLAVLLSWTAWRRRAIIVSRLSSRARPTTLWIAAAAMLGTWFALNAVFLSDGALARRLLGLFVLVTVPATIVAFSADAVVVRQLQRTLIVLGVLVAAADLYVLALQQASDTARFSPLATLDPITAALVPAYGALATLTLAPRTAGRRRAALALGTALSAAALLPGTRGPVLALVGAVAVVVLGTIVWSSGHREFQIAATFAAAIGLIVGAALSQTFVDAKVNSVVETFTGADAGTSGKEGSPPVAEPISSFSIRRQWLEQAIRAVPDKPILGHGVAALVDDTPEAHRMGIAGKKVYPHSDLVEAAYSLGFVGLIPFLLLVLVPAYVLVGLWRRSRTFPPTFIVSVFAAAFVMANTSGEIGSDAILWSSAALAVVAADRRLGPALMAARDGNETFPHAERR